MKTRIFWIGLFLSFLSHFGSITANQKGIVSMEETSVPPYLYKILSYRNWLATQSRKIVVLSAEDSVFIHFSTEDQLQRILEKYWSDQSNYVILKVDTSMVKGRMAYEANPGGSNRYYHLYDGCIHFEAIAEAKIVYRDRGHVDHSACSILSIEQIGSVVLRQNARSLSKEEILSPEIQDLIRNMKETMRKAPGVGLAAPQVGKSFQLIVIEDMDHSHLTAEQISERERSKVPFHVLINPVLHVEEKEMASFFEGCLSVSGLLGIVPRAKAVRVEALNENAQPYEIKAKGWYARILQHEIDHLKGVLFVDRANPRTLVREDVYVQLWSKKSIHEVQRDLEADRSLP
jgi:peptide deformylase